MTKHFRTSIFFMSYLFMSLNCSSSSKTIHIQTQRQNEESNAAKNGAACEYTKISGSIKIVIAASETTAFISYVLTTQDPDQIYSVIDNETVTPDKSIFFAAIPYSRSCREQFGLNKDTTHPVKINKIIKGACNPMFISLDGVEKQCEKIF